MIKHNLTLNILFFSQWIEGRMWPNNHPPSSRASPGDHFINNPTATNPYSRNASVSSK